MQATGRLHLGNWVGALQNWVRLQEQYDCFYFVADWHALTTAYQAPGDIPESTRDLLVNFLASGLDPQRAVIFIQSWVPQHAELHLALSMLAPLGWLERVPTYKEKKEELRDKDLGTYGFLGYPVLQSADILLYRAELVPVGQDQLPHLELTRELARRFNYLYGPVLPEPQALLTEFPKLPGTDGRKMSKSYDNAIYLSDPPEVLRQKVRTMMTDPARKRRTDPGEPELSPVYQLHKVFSSAQELKELAQGCRAASIGCLDCKEVLIRNMFKALEPLWQRRRELLGQPSLLRDIAAEGARKASAVAQETLQAVKEAMGLKFS